MAQTTPRDLMYSAALKPVSIASTSQTRKFLPITSGTYTATSNNIIRIPVNANGFVDMKNCMLKYTIKGKTAAAYFNGAHSPISRFQVLSPDGAPLETIDGYNRVYAALSALEMSRDNSQGIQNLISGMSNEAQEIKLTGVGAQSFTAEMNGSALATVNVGAAGALGTYKFGNYNLRVAVLSDTVAEIGIQYLNETEVVFTRGTAKEYAVGGNTFSIIAPVGSPGVPAATAFFINGVNIFATGAISFLTNPRLDTLNNTSEALAVDASRTYAHNPMSCLTKLDVLYPAFSVGGGGVVLELTLDTDLAALVPVLKTGAPTYEITAVELVVPVIQYPESVVQSFKQMLNSVGAVSMSSVSLQNYVYPYTGAANFSLSIPIAVRNRSLKAIYFFFQETISSNNHVNRMAHDNPTTMNYYLRIGSQYFPAQQVQYSSTNLAEAVIELEKSVSKLNDVRHGSLFNSRNFVLSAANGGVSMFGIDLESSPVSYLESGVNTADNALSTYLEINNITGLTAGGNVQIFALFDNTLSIMANGNIVLTK
jgi:hypothetical protein